MVCSASPDNQIRLFCEVEGISLPSILESLTHLRPRVQEMSERVHVRSDIAW